MPPTATSKQRQCRYLHQQFVLVQANTKNKGDEQHRNHSGTCHAEMNQVDAKKQSDQPSAFYHGPIAGQPSPQQDGEHSDAHRPAEGIGITPEYFTPRPK